MKSKICIYVIIFFICFLFTGFRKNEKNFSSVKFSVSACNNQISKVNLNTDNYLKDYAYFTIESVEENNTDYCLLQSWDTISNSIIKLEKNVDYEINNEKQNLININANVKSKMDNNLARCTVIVNFHN